MVFLNTEQDIRLVTRLAQGINVNASQELIEKSNFSSTVIMGFVDRVRKVYPRQSSIGGGTIIENGVYGINTTFEANEKQEILNLLDFISLVLDQIINDFKKNNPDWDHFQELLKEYLGVYGNFGLHGKIDDRDDVVNSRKIITKGLKGVSGIATSQQNKTILVLRNEVEAAREFLDSVSKGANLLSFARSLERLVKLARFLSSYLIW